MEQKIKSLKTASNILSVITKIGYSVMIVMMALCAALLLFLAVTGGTTSGFTIGGTNVIIFDKAAATPAELAAICAVLLVMGGLFFATFLLAYRMFHEISLTGKPFAAGYGKTVRVIGVLTAVSPIAAGLVESIASAVSATNVPALLTDLPGIGVGAIIFCLSYIIDYGCGLEKEEMV